ncbi:MAG: fibronectin type III domain-containing protein, partial [Paludibacteraceae bacterium]|nr:fibronectin type III domain-containing protein [Paludibacteraceae bacterium]
MKERLANETGWPNDHGNPGDRIVNCITNTYPGLYWELAPYTAENALCLRNMTNCVNSGRLTFKNVGCYQKLYFLTFAGGVQDADRTMTTTVYYSTGDPDVHTFEFLDCASVTERRAYITQIYSSGFVKGQGGGGYVYAAVSEMGVDTDRLIDSIHFSYTGNSGTGIAVFAVTGMTADIAAPASGSSLKTTDISNNSFVASWEAVEGAKTYRIDVATDEDFHHMVEGFNNEAVITGTDTIIEGLGADSEYYWRVRAVDNEGGQSASSSPRRVRTAPEDGMPGPATRENDEDIETDIAEWVDMDMASIAIYRTLYRDGYFNTICLPFNLDPAGIAASPIAGCELFEYVSAVKSESQLDISIRPIDHIVAGVP